MTAPAPASNRAPPAPPPKRKGGRLWLRATLAVLLLLPLVLLAGLLLAAHTERGSRALWQLATLTVPGRLSGTYTGGTLAHGMQLQDVDYRNGALQFRVDRFASRWQLSRAPLTLTVEYLHFGRVALQLPPPAQPTPSVMPQDLQAPLALRLKVLTIQQLDFQRGATQLELSALALHASSNRLRHDVVLETVQTPYGKASAELQLNGRAPFALRGGAELSGSYRDEGYRLDAHWSGTLAELALELSASGDRLHGQAQIALAPYSQQPLLRAQVSATHINPRLFIPTAPEADLTLHADLVPEPTSQAAPTKPAPNGSAPADHRANMLTVSGPVTLTNAIPGTLDQQRLPVLAATFRARLNAQSQQLTDIRIRLPGDALLSGEGHLQRTAGASSGEFRLAAERLDLHALHARLKPTRLRGPLVIGLQPAAQQLSLDLADAQYRLQLAAQMDASQIRVRRAQLDAGVAQLQLSGTLARDAKKSYGLSGTLRDFDPALWIDTGAGSTPSSHALPDTKRAGKARSKGAPSTATTSTANPNRALNKARASRVPSARINMDFDASGAFAPQLQLALRFGIHDSSYDQLPLTGGGTLNLAGQRLLPSAIQLQVAGNQFSLQGSFGRAGDRLQVKLEAPQLQRLGYGLEGLLQLDGDIAGSLQQPNVRATYRAEKLTFGAHHLEGLSGRAEVAATLGPQAGSAGSAARPASAIPLASALRVAIELDAHGYRGPEIVLQKVHAQLDGSERQHSFSAEASGTVRGQPLALILAAHGALSQDRSGRRWDGSLDTLQNQGRPRLALNAPLALSAGAGRLVLGPTRLTLADAVLDLKSLAWEDGRVRSEGKMSALAVANLLQVQQEFSGTKVPFITDLVLDGSWNFELGQSASGFARLARRRGDITLESERGATALGLSALQLQADLQPDGLQLKLQAAASRIGTAALQAHARWSRQDGLLRLGPDAPLAGRATVRLPQLKTVATLAGPQLALDGSLAMDLDLAGTVAQPKWSGTITGDGLALTLFDLGIRLHDGVVRIGLEQNLITLQQIEFHGGEGTLRASGQLQLGEANPALSATVVADHLQLFASLDRRLTLSGQAKVSNAEQHLRVDGKVTVDTALFDLPKKSAPKLGDDVVVLRRTKDDAGKLQPVAPPPPGSNARRAAGAWSPVVNLDVNLGRDFRFRGNGADLLLRGNMLVHSEPYAPLRATGTVRVVEGTYEAFGRKLAIERGLLNFQGPINNPNINILAMRRNQEVEAGVEVTGLAQQPRVRLVSEPNVAEEEKLSWLMFGHGSESGGLGQQQAAGAALALLGNAGGKRIAQGVGLDEFSIGTSESGLADQQVVNLGKAISERFYVGYEQSLTGAASIIKVTYQLSQRWSLVARAGAISGLDILFNKRFDGARDKRKVVEANRDAAAGAAVDGSGGTTTDEP